MPDVSRSDSQRSDSSRPRVSFNRDVHVKRIGTPGAPRVIGALTGDGEGHLVSLPVRRERTTRLSRRQLAKEAELVLAQADSVKCTSRSLLESSESNDKNEINTNKKYNTLPPIRHRNKKKNNTKKTNLSLGEESPASSPDRTISKSKHNLKKSNIEDQVLSKDSPVSTLDRKSTKTSGKNILASVFSSLDRSLTKKNKHTISEKDSEHLRSTQKNSLSLDNLVDNSVPERPKRKTNLNRSVSDASSKKNIKNNIKVRKSGGFLSLDRLTVKRNKNKNKSISIHSDYSDKSPPRPRKNILKKSYSDSESTSQLTTQDQNLHSEGRKKKQLSPIIEIHPREDYFNDKKYPESPEDSTRDSKMLHSSQLPTQKPALTRGQTVDAMVKRLSQDFTRSRGPPRVINSAPGLITPEHRQHNNNLPFSYTEPTTQQYGSSTPTQEPTRDNPLNSGPATRAPTSVDGQVIYAEVVVSGGGGSGGAVSKQTVHTKVQPIVQLQPEEPIQPKVNARRLEDIHFQETSKVFPSESYSKDSSPQHKVKVKVTEHNQKLSDEDEGLGLTMDHNGYRRISMDYVDEGRNYGRKGVIDSYNRGNVYTTKGGYIESNFRNSEQENDVLHNSSRYELRTDYGITTRKDYAMPRSKYESEDYIVDSSLRGRADGMDSRKKDFMSSEKYNSRQYDDDYYHHNYQKDDTSSNVRRNLLDDFKQNESHKSEYFSDARIVPADESNGRTHYDRDFLLRNVDSNDLSSRRDRLEYKIESQRRERFSTNKYSEPRNFKRDELDTRNELNRQGGTDIAYNNRRDFLNSQLDYEKSPTHEDLKYENDKNYRTKDSHYFESFITTSEVDNYGKKDLFADSGIEIDYRTKESSKNLRKHDKSPVNDTRIFTNNHHAQNVSRIDFHNHPQDHISDDDDETELNKNIHHYNNTNNYNDVSQNYQNHKTKTNSFTSTKLVQEQKHSKAIPSSTVLIRHWIPTSKEDTSKKKISPQKTKPENQQQLLSDEEYDEYEQFRRKEEQKKNTNDDYRNTDSKGKVDDKGSRNVEKKPTKKKQNSTMDKMKQLFTRSDTKLGKRKKKEDKVKVVVEAVEEEDEVDPLTSRYTEYKGSNIDLQQDSPRLLHRGKGHVNSSSIELEQGTPKPVHKNRKLQTPDRSSNMELDQDAKYHPQKLMRSPKPSHKESYYQVRRSNAELNESNTNSTHREVSQEGLLYRNSSDAEDHKGLKVDEQNHSIRQRLATPSSSPSPPRAHNKSTSATLTRINNMKNKEYSSSNSGGWFKSLDRLTNRGKNKTKDQNRDTDVTTEDESRNVKQNNNKNLRFFGDTDRESVSSILHQPNHTILRRYKSNNSTNGMSNNRLQVPSRNLGGGGLRHHRSAGDVATSSAESTTEGDSSQQSQRSVVYLHAATVGDIPGPPRSQRSGITRRAQSREELSSNGGSTRPLQQQSRTVSRSISVLAPWKPRHYKEGLEVHYDNNESNRSKTLGRNNNGGKPPKVPSSSQINASSTINRTKYKNGERGKENNSLIQKQKVNKAISVESLSQRNGNNNGQYIKDKTTTLKKQSALNSSTSVESLNQKQTRDKTVNSKKYSALNSSATELNSNKSYRTKKVSELNGKKSSNKVSRSASMPKDSRLTAGWFKLRNKKQGT